jgi:hypothetical protein
VYIPTDYSVLAGRNARERDEWRAYAKKLERDLAALRRGIVERDRAIAQRDESIGRLKAMVAVAEDRVVTSVRLAMASNAALSIRMLEGVNPALAERIAADEAAESERTAKRVEQTRQLLAQSINARY